MENGLIHLYYGYGKGKTTSAIGLAIRAIGSDNKILFTSFLKDFLSGEFEIIKNHKSKIELFECSPVYKFYKDMTDEEKDFTKKSQHRVFLKTIEKAIKDNYDVLILDELIDLIDLECITVDEVVDFLKSKPSSLEVVITGHSENLKLIEISDYVTEFLCKKHPYYQGISARKGIEL